MISSSRRVGQRNFTVGCLCIGGKSVLGCDADYLHFRLAARLFWQEIHHGFGLVPTQSGKTHLMTD